MSNPGQIVVLENGFVASVIQTFDLVAMLSQPLLLLLTLGIFSFFAAISLQTDRPRLSRLLLWTSGKFQIYFKNGFCLESVFLVVHQ